MKTNHAPNYYLEHSLLNKGISIWDVFMALWAVDPAYEYELEGADSKEIDLLEHYIGRTLPACYKDFLLLAGRRPGKYYMYGATNQRFLDFGITTLLNFYEQEYQKDKKKKKKQVNDSSYFFVIAIPTNVCITDHPDEPDILCLDDHSGKLSSEFVNYPSLQEFLFHYGFTHLQCGEKLGYYKQISSMASISTKLRNPKATIEAISDALLSISGSQQYAYSSGAFQYFSFREQGIHAIMHASSDHHDYFSLYILLFSPKKNMDKYKKEAGLRTLVNQINPMPFVKELGLEYKDSNTEYWSWGFGY